MKRPPMHMDGVFQTTAVLATLLTGIVCCIAVLCGVNAMPAVLATFALYTIVACW